MKLMDFLKDRGMLLLFHLVCMFVLSFFLKITGYNAANTTLILIFWVILLLVWLSVTYLQRRNYFHEMEQILENVDQRYLLGELLPDSFRLEDRLYREMIHKSNKSVIERIRKMEEEQNDYREYIESWIHEIKAPITSIALICNNRRHSFLTGQTTNPDEDLQTIHLENQKIENYADMALYYARSKEVYKDYLIRKTNLKEVVCEVLEKNRLLFIQNQVQAEINCEDMVYTDKKWIAFILNQILLNSVKYKKETPVFHIHTSRGKNGVFLTVEDNGTGIRREELSRIFEKGFTGSNGRAQERSTGMGLYLCRKLCDRLGIGLRAQSEYGSGTKMILEFPLSNMISRRESD